MKKFIYSFAILITVMSCSQEKKEQTDKEQASTEAEIKTAYYGEKIDDKGYINVTELPEKMQDKDSLEIKVKGEIKSCCKKKGCFMTFDLGNGKDMMVRFKDYGFFVPKDADGDMAIFEGVARKEVIDVAALKHYAEDKGKSAEEIAAITEPEEKIVFEASGVIIEKNDTEK